MSLVASPSKGVKRTRDGKRLEDNEQDVIIKTKSNVLVGKFYVSFVNDALEKKKEGEIGPYDELISQFTSTDIQEFEKLKPWLDALSNVVSQLDKSHLSLVEAIMSISWTVSSHSFVQTYKTFVFMLVSAHPGYIKLLLGKLIKGFTHQANSKALEKLSEEDKNNLKRRTVFDRSHNLLIKLLDLVPTLPSLLQPILIRHFPHKRENKVQQVTYMKNLLSIINYCPALSDEIFGLIVDRTIQIDVEIQVELEDLDDELEDETEAIFETEPDIFERAVGRTYSDEESSDDSDDENLDFLSDLSSDDGLSDDSQDAPMQVSAIKDLVQKLDDMLLILFEHLEKTRQNTQELQLNQFSTLLSVFERTILPTFRSRYTQFTLFKYSSYDAHFADVFQGMLLSKAIFQSDEPSVTRIVAASYLASYVSRARFIDSDSTKRVVGLMCDYIGNELDNVPQPITNFKLNTYSVWFAIVQAVFYIFCFRWRDLMLSNDDETIFDHAEALPIGGNTWIPGLDVLQRAILSPLNPLKVCASTVVNQFAKVSQFAGFLYCHSIIESNKRSDVTPSSMSSLSTSLLGVTQSQSAESYQKDTQTRSLAVSKNNGTEIELDSFFPFDPYRLPRTQKYISSIYRNWDEVAIIDEEDDSDDESEHLSKSNPSQSLGKSLEAMSISPLAGNNAFQMYR
ncbi:RNA polymerase I-specific transcription initiation factor RRN3 [Wallemia mellicola]|nr:RNA polymerase I-specific transcription initiation factor RRN3 [Wallemia mellicola]